MADASQIKMGYGTPPATPAAGYSSFYFKADKKLYAKDDAGVETQIAFGSGTADLNAFTHKTAVRVATVVAGALATAFANGQTVDSIVLATGDRILIKNQAAPAENGLYTVNAVGAPTRATDADTALELAVGAVLFVREGTINAGTAWQLTTLAPITLGVTALVFARAGLPKCNFAGVAAPTTADNESLGYQPGSLWVWDNADQSRAFILAGFDAADAVWREVDRAVGPANAVYVSTTGNDTLGRRGDASRPFLTVKQALSLCQSGDTLHIAAGTYTMGAGATPVWPAGVNKLTIIGEGHDGISGGSGTYLENTANDGSHIFSPPNTATYVEIRNLVAHVTLGAGRPLNCDGNGSSSFLGGAALASGGLYLDNVLMCAVGGAGVAMYLRYVGRAVVSNSMFIGSSEIRTSNVLSASDCLFFSTTIEWDNAAASKPTVGRAISKYFACEFSGEMSLSKQPFVVFDRSCKVADSILGTGLSANAALAPRIVFAGEATSVDFQSAGAEFPDTANIKECNFDFAKITALFAVKVAGAAANRLQAYARNAILTAITTSVVIDNGVDLDMRGAHFSEDGSSLSTAGNGTLLPSRITRSYATDGTSTDPNVDISEAVPLTFSRAPDVVLLTPRSLAGGFFACTARNATQLTIAYSVNAVATVDIGSFWY